jgi:hypothetical protein
VHRCVNSYRSLSMCVFLCGCLSISLSFSVVSPCLAELQSSHALIPHTALCPCSLVQQSDLDPIVDLMLLDPRDGYIPEGWTVLEKTFTNSTMANLNSGSSTPRELFLCVKRV